MATVEGTEYKGPKIIDMSDVAADLTDLPPGAMKGMRAAQEGIDGVVGEVVVSTPEQREAADIPAHVHQRFVTRTERLTKLREKKAVLAKALEVCTETCTKMENDREDDISVMAKAVRVTADRKRNPAILAPFEKLINYNSQIALKAAQTRKKNAEAKKAAVQPAEPPGEPAPPA